MKIDVEKKNLCTSITISGHLTLAHYLIVIQQALKEQEKYNLFFSIADLHAITTSHQIDQLLKLRRETASYLFACGIKEDNVFIQSQIHGHSELCFILGCYTSIGALKRMTQFKSKSKIQFQSISLLNYPLLMASDILLYDADVLVGNDQKQHVELTRDVAIKINNKVGKEVFYVPKLIKRDFFSYRIRDLQNPKQKMSKSESKKEGIIFLHDTKEEIRNKIISAKTDSDNQILFDFEQKPGISNLIFIYALIKKVTFSEAKQILQKECSNYLILKNLLVETIIEVLQPIQEQAKHYYNNYHLVEKFLNKGRKRAQLVVNKKFNTIQLDLGFEFNF